MAKKAANPFAILGLPPECLVGLTEHQTRRLVAERGRALSALFHTDTNKEPGAEARFKTVQIALDELSIDVLFDEHLRNHMRASAVKAKHVPTDTENWIPEFRPAPRVKTRTETEEEYREEYGYLADAMGNYVQGLVKGRSVVRERYETKHGFRYSEAISVFDPPPCRILLIDSLRTRVLYEFRRQARLKATAKEVIYGISLNLELEIREDGSVWSYPVEKVIKYRPDRDEPPPPSSPEEWIRPHRQEVSSHYFRRKTEVGTPMEDRLIGTLNYPYTDKMFLARQDKIVMRGHDNETIHFEATEGYRFEQFKLLAYRMSPLIRQSLELIAVNLRLDEPRYRFVGTVMAMTFP
jgi:hypothetical protein